MSNLPFGLTGLMAVVAVIYAARSFRIVRQFEKGLVETFGQYSRTAPAGLTFLFAPFQSLRKVDMREQVMDVPDETSDKPADEVESLQQRACLQRQIDELPESYKMLVILRYQQELSYEEIANVLSLPLGTVKTGLFLAKALLRQALAELEGQPI